MSIEKSAVLNLILIVFPMLLYFIYNCYKELKCEKYNNLLLDVTLISSVYLFFKYGDIDNNNLLLLFCNLPIIISYLKREWKISLLLSLIVIIYSFNMFHVNLLVMILKYCSYFVVYLIGTRKQIRDNTFILLVAILQGFFISVEYFYSFNNNIFEIVDLIFIVFLFYLLPFFLLWLFNLGDKISRLYLTVYELEKEKQVKNSLFKITHEVKNPIAVCKGYLDMIDGASGDEVNRYLTVVKEEIDRSLGIMNDFMEFSKIKIDKDIIDINLLLDDVCSEMKLLFNRNKVCFDYRIVNDEIFVMGDYNRLKQVFVNLIKNSYESIEKNGNISVMTHILKDILYIEIDDNGCGMDKETLDRVKEMFFTTKNQGTGLGVSLSNEIIKAHGGQIKYNSKIGVGTKVVVKIPIYMV